MINPGYLITDKDREELNEFKKGAAYSNYLKSISMSPAYIAIMKEHIENVDISEDIEKLKKDNRLPESLNANSISELFKFSLSKMAIPIVADTIILREAEEIKLDEIISNLNDDANALYLLGMADEKYYKKAAELVKKGELDEDSLAFRGLLAYQKNNKKRKNKSGNHPINTATSEKKEIINKFSNNKEKEKTIDIRSDNIEI